MQFRSLPKRGKRGLVVQIVLTTLIAFLVGVPTINYIFKLKHQELQRSQSKHAELYKSDVASFLYPQFQEAPLMSALKSISERTLSHSVFILNQEGLVLYSSDATPIENLQLVDVKPIQRFIDNFESNPDEYIPGFDPLGSNQVLPFSATNLTLADGSSGYLYVVLHSKKYQMSELKVHRASMLFLVIVWLAVLVVGSVSIISQEHYSIQRAMADIDPVLDRVIGGDYSARVDVNKAKEMDYIGGKINAIITALSSAIGQLEETDQFRRELISNISHDLNTPLSSATGYVGRALRTRDDVNRKEHYRYLEIAEQNLQMLGTLIRDLFEFSKLDARDVEPSWVAFSLLDVVTEEVFPNVQALAEDRQVTVRGDYPNELRYAYGDSDMLTRVISNLVENGIRYNHQGGEVVVSLVEKSDSLQVSVIDNGEGISVADQKRVFERFYRGAQERKKGGGSGLGLAIAKKILAAHNSQIDLTSELGVGTTFSFELPLAPQLVDEDSSINVIEEGIH